MNTDSILFLLGTDIGAERTDDYLVQQDPDPKVADHRDSEPPPASVPPTIDDPPPSSRVPPSSRARGPRVPSIFDVVEFGVAPRNATLGDQAYDHAAGLSGSFRLVTENPSGMREAIGSIMVDDRDGPASNRIAVQERIQNRSRIRDLADTLVRYRSVGVLNSAYHAPMHVRAASIYRHANAMCWEITEPFPAPPFVIEVVGFNSVFQFTIQAASMRDGLMLTPLPPEVVRLRRRWGRRTGAPAGWSIEVRTDDSSDRHLYCALRDISFTGVSFWVPKDSDWIHPGTNVTRTWILVPGHEPIEAGGDVSFVARDGEASDDLCGMQLRFEKLEERHRWREIVSRQLHPTTGFGTGYHSAIWDLYRTAGYFNLSGKDPARFSRLEERFRQNAARIDAAPELGCLVVWPAGDKALATISMLKIYEGSWLVYQLAKVRGDAPDGTSGRQILRDVHLRAYEHAQLDPDLKWCIGYPQVLEPPIWSHSVHYELPRRYTTAGLACIVRFRALEVRSARSSPDRWQHGFEIDEPTSEELAGFFRWLKRERPHPYAEAYDLTRDRLDLTANKTAWRRMGLRRERQVRVARHQGRMVAIAVLEDAAEGLHLFRLLDAIRPFPMTANLELASRAIDALVESAKDWYLRRDKETFCCFLEDDDWLPAATRLSLEDMGQADTTILSAQLLPELLEEVARVTAPRS